MSIVVIGLGEEMHAALDRIGAELHAPTAFVATLGDGLAMVGATPDDAVQTVILGQSIDQPVQALQRLHAVASDVPVIVVVGAENQDALAGALKFSPFVGLHVHCAARDAEVIADLLRHLVDDHRRLRRHRATLAAFNAQLERASSPGPHVEAAEYLSQVLECAPIGIVATDEAGIITGWNRHASSLFGATERAVLGSSLRALLPPSTAESWLRLSVGGPHSVVLGRPVGQGAQWLDVLGAPLVGRGGQRGRLFLVQDITARVAAEEKLEETIEREKRARADAEAANHAKDQFMSIVSHELRTPLTAILGWVEVLRRSPGPEKTVAVLEVIERNGRAQAQLIEDLLDVGRITSGKLRLELRPIDLADVVDLAIASAQPAADAKGVPLSAIVPRDGTLGSLDAARMQQVVWNLLSNAVKFTPKGGHVHVALRRIGDTLELTVVDEGEGMTAEFLPYLFDRFRQADSPFTRSRGGLGLGLAISRHIVELHGGTIEGESGGPGKGARFTVRLPARTTSDASL